MRLPIVKYGDPVLRKKCRLIEKIDDEIRQLAADMIETFDEGGGIGIAAPQVGKDLCMFALRRYEVLPDETWALSEPYVYINPEIISVTEETWIENEGCLSIPGLQMPVERPVGVVIRAQNLAGEVVEHALEGMNARVIFHENDHIQGILFIDRLSPELKVSAEAQLKTLKNS